jgi:predicted nucleotidyltransferase
MQIEKIDEKKSNKKLDKKLHKKFDKELCKNPNKKLLKQTLFTVAYYNTLGYYPESFFIWKNLINIKGNGEKSSLLETLDILECLEKRKLIMAVNGMYKVSSQFTVHDLQVAKLSKFSHEVENLASLDSKEGAWYKKQIQKNKISVEKIKKAKRIIKISRWLPYLRGIFLTGTLAMKRGGINSDWDVLVILKKNRIWLGRLFATGWFHLIGRRRYGKMISDRFCLNQFMVESNLELKENNEFIGNELLTMKKIFGKNKLNNEILQKNKNWIKLFKPNFNFRKNILDKENGKYSGIIQNKLEMILETFQLAEMMNIISKKIMIKKIINNPKTYAKGADIRYGDFFLVFLPYPQREKIRQKTLKVLTKINL